MCGLYLGSDSNKLLNIYEIIGDLNTGFADIKELLLNFLGAIILLWLCLKYPYVIDAFCNI